MGSDDFDQTALFAYCIMSLFTSSGLFMCNVLAIQEMATGLLSVKQTVVRDEEHNKTIPCHHPRQEVLHAKGLVRTFLREWIHF